MIPRLKADLRFSDLLALRPRGNKFADIRAFESAFARLAGQDHAVFFPYGRTAQMAILKALHLEKSGRTEVIMPSYSCVVVAHAITQAGLTPVFVDVGDDYNMRLDLLNQATTEKTGAVIATSIFGHPVDLDALDTYRRQHPDIPILQDCAHSFLAQYQDGRYVHQQGLCAFYGLNISKIITSIFGGMVTTDDAFFAEKLREERQALLRPSGWIQGLKRGLYLMAILLAFTRFVYGVVNHLERSGWLDRFTKYYSKDKIDWPSDGFHWPSGIQARIGLRQCGRYADIVDHRRRIAALYHQGLSAVEGLILPPKAEGATISHFVVQTENASQIEQKLLKKGVQLGRLIDYEIPDMPVYQDAPYFGAHHSRILPTRVLNLPVHMGVTEKDAQSIMTMIQSVLGE